MNDKYIENLIILLNKYNLNKIKIKQKDFFIEIGKKSNNNDIILKQEVNEKKHFKIIKAPLVGIFYLSPAPNQKPFVQEGDKIKKGDIVCIIEAMKNLHQVKSDYSGIISKIIAKNEKFVEYNEDLIIIKNV